MLHIASKRIMRAGTHLSYQRGCHVRIPLLYLRGLPRADTLVVSARIATFGYPLVVSARMPRADTHLLYLRGGNVRIPLLYLRGLPRADTHLLYLLGLPRADRGEFLREYFYKFKGIKTPNYYKAYFL